MILGSVPNVADQRALYDLVKERERGGKRLTNETLEELIRMNQRTSTKTESNETDGQTNLFGAEEMTRSLLPEKAEVSTYVRKQLAAEKKLFGAVSTDAAAQRLGEAGNVIQASENKAQFERTNQGVSLYDKLSTKAGPIDSLLDQAARSLADGENPNEVKQRAYRQIRDHLTAQVRQLSGVPQGSSGRAEGLGGEGPRQAGAGQPSAAGPSGHPAEVAPANARYPLKLGDVGAVRVTPQGEAFTEKSDSMGRPVAQRTEEGRWIIASDGAPVLPKYADELEQGYQESRRHLPIEELPRTAAVRAHPEAEEMRRRPARQEGPGLWDQPEPAAEEPKPTAKAAGDPLTVEEFSRQAAQAEQEHRRSNPALGDTLTKQFKFGKSPAPKGGVAATSSPARCPRCHELDWRAGKLPDIGQALNDAMIEIQVRELREVVSMVEARIAELLARKGKAPEAGV